MRSYFFTEMPYPFIPPDDEIESIRVELPNKLYDPKIGADLYNRYIDEMVACDELGLHIMINEHHQTATCLDSAAPLVLSVLARETKQARLLILGNPAATRRDPVRIAEEMAIVDNLSYGRLELGLIRGIPYELAAANANPVGMYERLWEAYDLISKAFTHRDGPFNWEGKHFDYRQVNIWPRPYQQPAPPMWVTATSPDSAAMVGARGATIATLITGLDGTKAIFDSYRAAAVEAGHYKAPEDVPTDRFGYMVLAYVGDTDEEGRAGAEKITWYLKRQKSAPQWMNPPGFFPAERTAKVMKTIAGGGSIIQVFGGFDAKTASLDELIDRAVVVAGNPDTVFKQIKRFYDYVGGCGHMLFMGQAGEMNYEETMSNLNLWAKEVQPRLDELDPT